MKKVSVLKNNFTPFIRYFISVAVFITVTWGKEYTFYDIQNLVQNKYGVTLIIDKSIKKDYVIYSQNLKRDITLKILQDLCQRDGFNFHKKDNFIHITQKSKMQKDELDFRQKQKWKKQEKEIDEDDFFTDGIKTDLPRKAVLSICKQMNYDCTYISNGAYMVRAKNDEVDLSLFAKYIPSKQYALMGTIVEINKNKLKDKHIDINAFVSTLLTSNYLDLNLIGEYGSYFKDSIGSDNKVSVTALFKFFTSNGIAKVTSKPYLVLEDSEEISFSTGQTLTVAASVTTNNETSVSQTNYSTVQVGLSIKAKPEFAKNYIYLDLNLDISSLLDYDKDKNIANIANRSLSGKYRLTPGREIKLVGFEQSYKNEKSFKVPILGEIPGIGQLFRSNYEDDKNTLLLVTFKLIEVNK